MARYSDILRDQYLRPIEGAYVSVIDQSGEAASIFDDGGLAMPNPFITNEFGDVIFNASDAVYRLQYRYGGRLLREDTTIVGQPPEFSGPPGPADNTYFSLAALKASAVSQGTANLRVDGLDGKFNWTAGDFTGKDDDVNIIQSDNVPINEGAWVRQKATDLWAADGNTVQANIDRIGSFTQDGDGAVLRTPQEARRDIVTIKDFGAIGDGETSDDTALTDALTKLATGQSLRVPGGQYVLSQTSAWNSRRGSLRSDGEAILDFSAWEPVGFPAVFTISNDLDTVGNIWGAFTQVIEGHAFLGNSLIDGFDLTGVSTAQAPGITFRNNRFDGFRRFFVLGDEEYLHRWERCHFRGDPDAITADGYGNTIIHIEKTTNAGENNNVDNCVFTNGVAFDHVEGAAEFKIFSSSFDYTTCTVRSRHDSALQWRSVCCHFENDGQDTRLQFDMDVPTGTSRQYYAFVGGDWWHRAQQPRVIGSWAGRAHVMIRDCTFLIFQTSRNMSMADLFRGATGSETFDVSGCAVETSVNQFYTRLCRAARISPDMTSANINTVWAKSSTDANQPGTLAYDDTQAPSATAPTWVGSLTTDTTTPTTVTVESTTSGALNVGDTLYGSNIPAGAYIKKFGTYTTATGTGTIEISLHVAVSATSTVNAHWSPTADTMTVTGLASPCAWVALRPDQRSIGFSGNVYRTLASQAVAVRFFHEQIDRATGSPTLVQMSVYTLGIPGMLGVWTRFGEKIAVPRGATHARIELQNSSAGAADTAILNDWIVENVQ